MTPLGETHSESSTQTPLCQDFIISHLLQGANLLNRLIHGNNLMF